MSTIINARSPYFLKYRNATNTLTNVQLDIKIWSGLKTSVPTTIDYTVSKTPLVAEVGNFVVFEISQLIRDFLTTYYLDDTDNVDAVWVQVVHSKFFTATPVVGTSYYLALDGYGLYEELANPRESINPAVESYTPFVLQSNPYIQFVKGKPIILAVFSEQEPDIVTQLGTTSIVDSNDSTDKIQYLTINSNTFEEGDTIVAEKNIGGVDYEEVFTLEEVCDPTYKPHRIMFYNRFGALQSFWMPQKSTINTRTTDESYNSNTIEYDNGPVSYKKKRHSKKRYNVIATQGITLNTSLIKESYNDAIEEMLMSDQIWVEFSKNGVQETLPVILKSKSLVMKTAVNDMVMIQYSFDFDFAYEKINNVR